MSDYTSKRYRKMRQQFREDCRRNRLPCSICGNAIDYSLKFPNKWAFELHHIRPSSTFPHLHYMRANHAPSHSRCNKAQSDNPAPKPEEWIKPTW
jgi:5-methylcytosine-specific restriction endonuclease McrA